MTRWPAARERLVARRKTLAAEASATAAGTLDLQLALADAVGGCEGQTADGSVRFRLVEHDGQQVWTSIVLSYPADAFVPPPMIVRVSSSESSGLDCEAVDAYSIEQLSEPPPQLLIVAASVSYPDMLRRRLEKIARHLDPARISHSPLLLLARGLGTVLRRASRPRRAALGSRLRALAIYNIPSSVVVNAGGVRVVLVVASARVTMEALPSSSARLPDLPGLLADVLGPYSRPHAVAAAKRVVAATPVHDVPLLFFVRELLGVARLRRFYPLADPLGAPAGSRITGDALTLAPHLRYLDVAMGNAPLPRERLIKAWPVATIDSVGRLDDVVLVVTDRAIYSVAADGSSSSGPAPWLTRIPLASLDGCTFGPLAFESGLDPPLPTPPWGLLLACSIGPALLSSFDKAHARAGGQRTPSGQHFLPVQPSTINLGVPGLWASNLEVLASLVDDLALKPEAETAHVNAAGLPRLTAYQLMVQVVAAISPLAAAQLDPLRPALFHLDVPVYINLPKVLPATTLLPLLQRTVAALEGLPGLDDFASVPLRLSLSGVLEAFIDAFELATASHFGGMAPDHDDEVAFARSMVARFSLLSTKADAHHFSGPSVAVERIDQVVTVSEALDAIRAAVTAQHVLDPSLDFLLLTAQTALSGAVHLAEAPVSFPAFPPVPVLELLYGTLHAVYASPELDLEYMHRYMPSCELEKQQTLDFGLLMHQVAPDAEATHMSGMRLNLALHPALSEPPEATAASRELMHEIALVITAAAQDLAGPRIRVLPPHAIDALHVNSKVKARVYNAKRRGARSVPSQ
ncbi:uncharacterized protein AMSG_03261 [Thecamonas trahens ATCC 50062]|uniref:Uncharacterized protein n=1 Tax=Thecamonas trahens ATCC 50062 TaxID=461836 RepID=A0A0L0D3M3_THETB|nr:hypothetical protein AMSG_03261 [Thecamonas trahens ATCC 50062]KNC46830.1 hypothetical protein AMSG_03261 [Thecamonas trahens ATCC 50062]|eukprot:XP_013760105.1 hypothetical protein AMSG_03261 [Thecamonas trahens ATCC 50062]